MVFVRNCVFDAIQFPSFPALLRKIEVPVSEQYASGVESVPRQDRESAPTLEQNDAKEQHKEMMHMARVAQHTMFGHNQNSEPARSNCQL